MPRPCSSTRAPGIRHLKCSQCCKRVSASSSSLERTAFRSGLSQGAHRLRPDFGPHELSRSLGARFAATRALRRCDHTTSNLTTIANRPTVHWSPCAGAPAAGSPRRRSRSLRVSPTCDRSRRGVLLADLSWRADQALLHDAAADRPSIAELFDAAASREPQPADLESLTFSVPQRGHDVLLGPAGGFDRRGIEGLSMQRALAAMRASYSRHRARP